MASADKEPLHVLEGAKALFAWIGGATAGVSALIYACGYLVTRAHLNLLGLYGLVDYQGAFFFQEGAKFLLALPYSLGRYSLPAFVVLGAAFAVWRAVKFLFAHPRLRSFAPSLRSRIAGEPFKRSARLLAYAALLVILFFHASSVLGELQRPIAVSSLLYTNPAAHKQAAAPNTSEAIERALLHGDKTTLDDLFETLLIDIFASGILAWLAWRLTIHWRHRMSLTAPFFTVLGLYLLLLPMAYGVLQRPIRYPRVALVMSDGSQVQGESSPFLMSKDSDDFILWDRANRKLIWLPVDHVRRAEVWTVTPLFGDTSSAASDHGGLP